MKKIELAVFDWAGTTVDYGCFAPVKVFLEVFKEKEIEVTLEEARAPMGLLKIDHIKAMLSGERVADLWNKKYGREWNMNDVKDMYSRFEEKLFKILAEYTTPVPHCLETMAVLRNNGIKIGSTTGYTQEMMDIVVPKAAEKGYSPDFYVTPSSVSAGRPFPYMIFKNMNELKVGDLDCVLKIGDTISDIKEGRNAKVWTIGVLKGSSELGLSEDEVKELSQEELKTKMAEVEAKMLSAGAHMVIEDISKVPMAIEIINNKLAAGERA